MFSSSLPRHLSSSSFSHHDDHRRRKRNRTMQSCLPCHTNKRKCNRGRPCERCIGLSITGSCVYETEDPKVSEHLDINDPACEIQRLRDRVAELEGVVRILKGRPHPKQLRNSSSSASLAPSSNPASPTLGPISPTFTRSNSQLSAPWSPRDSPTSGPMMDLLRTTRTRNPSLDSSSSMPPNALDLYAPPSTAQVRPGRSSSFRSDYNAVLFNSASQLDGHRSPGSHPDHLPPRQSSCPPGMKGYAEDRNVIQDEEDGRKLFLGHAAGCSLLRKLQGLTSPVLKSQRLDDSLVSPPEKDELITAKVAYMGLFGGEIGKRWAFDMPGSVSSSAEALKVILDCLPSPCCAQKLLDIFLEEVDCFYHAWHTPTVVNCYQRFFDLSRVEQEHFPIPNLSVILAIITVTLDLTSDILDESRAYQGETTEEHQKRFKLWRSSYSQRMASCTVHCLKMASYLGHPSLECIQAQLILSSYMVNNGRCTDAWCFIGGVIKQAQCLGLHIDPSKLNSHMPIFEQEVRRRIWWSTQTWDVFLGIAFGWPAGVTLNDSDLPSDRPEESLMGDASPLPPGLPPQGVTELTYHIFNWETCLYARDMMDRIFGQAVWSWGKSTEIQEGPKYEEVVKLDVTIKTWYNRVPAAMRFEPDPLEIHSSNPAGSQPMAASEVFQPSSTGLGADDIRRRDPRVARQSLQLAISQNTILLLLHRPFISHSLENSTRPQHHIMSEEQCIRSSQVIIEAQRLLVELFPATRRMWYGWYQTFHAAMTCAWISLLRSPAHPMSNLARGCVALAIETFGMAGSAPEDTHLRACSQLRAIQSFINRRLNPTKTLTQSPHLFGPTSSLAPFAYGLGPHTLPLPGVDGRDQQHPFSTGPSDGSRTRQPMPLFQAYPVHPSYSIHPEPPHLGRCPELSPSTNRPPPTADPGGPGRVVTSAGGGAQRELTLGSPSGSSSESPQRSSRPSSELRAFSSGRQMHQLEAYPSIGQLMQHPQLCSPSVQGFLSPASGTGVGEGMNYCDVTGVGGGSGGSGSGSHNNAPPPPPLYAAQYALGSLPYQDVHVPLSVLLMQEVGSVDTHCHHQSSQSQGPGSGGSGADEA